MNVGKCLHTRVYLPDTRRTTKVTSIALGAVGLISIVSSTLSHTPITWLVIVVEQIPWASFQGGGLRSNTFVAIYQNVRLGL